MFRLFNEVWAPADDEGSGGGTVTKDDMLDFLNEEESDVIELETKTPPKTKEPETPPKDKRVPEDEDEIHAEEGEDDDELTELEEELEGPKDEDLELVTPVRRREILKKYPNLFKDFPYLEKAYYREQQFTELLPTIEDAKTAVGKAQTLDLFEKDIIQNGNTSTLLKAVREENPTAFYKLVDNYLPVLAQVDEKAYHHVLSNVTKHTIVAMVQESKRSGNEVLQNAAQILNQFVFGSSDFSPPSNLSRAERPEDKNKETEVNRQQQEFVKQRFEASRDDLNTRVNNTLKNTIEANIDPKKSMTDYVRKTASRDAMESLENLIQQDSRFRALTDKLWEKAFESNFSQDSVAKIKTAYLSKAKTLLPTVIKKARNEALKGIGKRVNDSDEGESETSKKGPVPSTGRPRSNTSSGKITKPTDIPKGMKTIDFLMQD